MRTSINLAILAMVAMLGGNRPSYAVSVPPVKVEEQFVYVNGGVEKPGRYDWFKGMTVLDAIEAAGGLTQSYARFVSVRIIHPDRTGTVYNFRPGLDDGGKPPVLKKGDFVEVLINLMETPMRPLTPKPAA